MNISPEVQEWIDKAEGDYRVARRELAVPDEKTYDSVFFHCQQCLEKYLKALLLTNQQPVPRTHDLLKLVELLLPYFPNWQVWLEDDGLLELNQGAVEIRYPGTMTPYALAAEMFSVTERFRAEICTTFGLNGS